MLESAGMRKTLVPLVAIFCFLSLHLAEAQTTTGEDVQSKCKQVIQGTPSFSSGFCAGFVGGVMEAQTMWEVWEGKGTALRKNPDLSFCLPERVTNDQIIKIFVKHLDDHPEELHKPAALILVQSLRGTFPCKLSH